MSVVTDTADTKVGNYGRDGRTYGQWWDWEGEYATVSVSELHDFCRRAYLAAGYSPEDAEGMSQHVLDKTLQGDHARGLVYFPGGVRAAKAAHEAGVTREVKVVRERGATAVVVGNGQVNRVAMGLAIEKARQFGVGIVGAKAPGGILTPYVQMAAEAGMVGIMFTQTGPGVAPWGGYQPLLGNAPLAVGIPARNHDPVIMDLCFTQSSASGVLLAASQDGVEIPPGLLLDEHGNPTTDPRDFSDEEHTRAGSMKVKGTLTPLGNSHKGSAMVFVIGLLASLLSETDPSWTLIEEGDKKGVGGSVLIAVDPTALNGGDVLGEVDSFIDKVVNAPRKDGVSEINYPGQRSQRMKREAWERDAVAMPLSQLEALIALGKDLAIDIPPSFT
jgi:L-2-hydroxycarboxylate dehydrogenase (NAD+)